MVLLRNKHMPTSVFSAVLLGALLFSVPLVAWAACYRHSIVDEKAGCECSVCGARGAGSKQRKKMRDENKNKNKTDRMIEPDEWYSYYVCFD